MLSFLRSPVLHIALVASLTVGFALAAAVGLTLAKFNQALSDAVDARYVIYAADLRSSIETGINLGLSLEEIESNIETIVTSRIAADEGIVSITVTDESDVEIFSLDRPLDDMGRAQMARQSLELENSFGQVVGRVTVGYAVGENRETILWAARTLGANALILAALTAGAASLACLIVLGPIQRRLHHACRYLAIDENGAGQVAEPKGKIERAAAQAAMAAATAMSELEALEASLPTPQGKGKA
jgi:hypothetical protein